MGLSQAGSPWESGVRRLNCVSRKGDAPDRAADLDSLDSALRELTLHCEVNHTVLQGLQRLSEARERRRPVHSCCVSVELSHDS